jgi:translation elongation factor EF-G
MALFETPDTIFANTSAGIAALNHLYDVCQKTNRTIVYVCCGEVSAYVSFKNCRVLKTYCTNTEESIEGELMIIFFQNIFDKLSDPK